MKVEQVATLVNSISQEILGESAITTEDLSNVVDIGRAIFDVSSVDNYVKKLINHIGKMIFVDRVYRGSAPSVLMDGWEYGSVCEKVSTKMPDAVENESWKLENGQVYEQDTFYAPEVFVKFFNTRVTLEIDMSFAERQAKESFSNGTQLNAFFSMLYNSVENSLTVKLDALIQRTVNNMIAATLNSEFPDANYEANSGVRAVNLLYLYNNERGQTLTAEKAMSDPDFLRFASYKMGSYIDRMAKISTLFNIGQQERFTSRDLMHIIMLSDFRRAADVYLQSDVFHDTLTEFPRADVIPFWQASGESYDFEDITAIDVNATVDITGDNAKTVKAVKATGILAVMFDRDALGVSNLDRRVTTHYNSRAEFFTNFYKAEAGYFNDFNENFVVFFVA